MKQVALRADGASGSAGPKRPLPSPGGHKRHRDLLAGRVRSMRQMRAFYRLSLLGSARGQPAEIASRVLREFAGTMGFRRAEIWLLDRLKRLRRLSGYGRVPAASDAQGVSLQDRSEEHTSELQSLAYLVCRLLLEKKKTKTDSYRYRMA